MTKNFSDAIAAVQGLVIYRPTRILLLFSEVVFMRKNVMAFVVFAFSVCHLFAQKHQQLQRVHYFYNSGWLVETSKHFLVFDFIPNKEAGISLANLQKQWMPNPQNKQVVVFVSHDHQDHYNDSIYTLQKHSQGIRFILGWQPKSRPAVQNLSVLTPGDSLVEKDLSVYTHPATDDGSAILVTVDGLTIYHAGDHALWVEELAADYTKTLAQIRTKALQVDLAFLPAARGMFTGCAVDAVMEKSVRLAAAILQPKTVALQHIGCADKLHRYGQVVQTLAALKLNWIVPEKFNSRLY